MGGTRSNRLPLRTAEGPRVSLAAGAVQARRGPARPEGAVEISRTAETASGFLNCQRVFESPRGHQFHEHLPTLVVTCGGLRVASTRHAHSSLRKSVAKMSRAPAPTTIGPGPSRATTKG